MNYAPYGLPHPNGTIHESVKLLAFYVIGIFPKTPPKKMKHPPTICVPVGKRLAAVATTVLLSLSGVCQLHAFTHPSIPFTTDDLNALKANLNKQPWASGYAALAADSHSSLSYTMQGPFATVARNLNGTGVNENLTQFENDMTAAYYQSLMWYFTGNTAYAHKAHDILIAWATTMTTLTGYEGQFVAGGDAPHFVTAADILRGTWSGWSASDTTTYQNYLKNVIWPMVGVPYAVLSANQGGYGQMGAVAIAAFCDDATMLTEALTSLTTDSNSGLRDTLPNGEVGDTQRDQGHSFGEIWALAWCGEVFWKQGIDVFSLWDNRILATAEYYTRYNLPGPTQAYQYFGATYVNALYSVPGGDPRSSTQNRTVFNIIQGAYGIRMGLSTPWTALYLGDQTETADSFAYRKPADFSTATPQTVTFPTTASLTTGLTSTDLNGATPAGSTSYNSGTWTLLSGYGGNDPWSTSGNDSVHFAYKQVTGDFTMIAEVTSVAAVGTSHPKAGLMLRDSLGTASNRFWGGFTAQTTFERTVIGWVNMPYGSNMASKSIPVPQIPYWVKMERVGNRVQMFHSPNGADWTPSCVADMPTLPSTVYVGLFGTSMTTGTAGSATFTNIRITGGDGGEANKIPPAPYAIYAGPDNGQVQLRWNEAFNATSYNVKRSTTSGSGYTTIATVSNTTYTDTNVSNGTTYYYVVTAKNSAGESGNSIADSATPQAAMVNVSTLGSANSDDYNTGSEGPAMTFDVNPGSKWYHAATPPAWISYDSGSGTTQTAKSYSITSANDVPERDPNAWTLQGSNDGSNWTTLDTESGQSFTYRYQTKSYSIASPAAYRYYRLNITANAGGASYGVQLSEFALMTDQGHLIPNGTYCIRNRRSNKALEVSNGSTADGAALDQWSYSGNNSQKWTLTDEGNGQYQIMGVASGKVIDVSGASTANGASLIIWPWSGANNQKWTITPTGGGFFKLTAVHSGKVADVNGGSIANGATIIQWPYSGGTNQQWSLPLMP